jgi:lysophospholipase L1-like esterase
MKILVFLFLMIISVTVTAQQNVDDCALAKEKLSRVERRLNDWAELNRFAEANAKLALPKKGENRVIFIGDSITDSWDDGGFGEFFPGKPYINRGISGQTTPQMLLRFRQDVIALNPKTVLIHAGTNDIAGNTGPMTLEKTGSNMASMAELAKANGIKVIFASVLPVSDYNRRKNGELYVQTKQRPPEKITELNNWLKNYAARNGHVYLNYFDAMVDEKGFLKPDLAYDGLHPNAKGYAVMTPLAEEAIKKALKSK